MNMWLNCDGQLWQCPITMRCFRTECAGTFFLKTEFSNGQELWLCDKCREEYWSYTTVAKEQPHNGTHDIVSSGDIYQKKCPYCQSEFKTFNPEDDICEACSMYASWGHPN